MDVGRNDLLDQCIAALFFVYRYETRYRRGQFYAGEAFLPEKVFEICLRKAAVRLDKKSDVDAQI